MKLVYEIYLECSYVAKKEEQIMLDIMYRYPIEKGYNHEFYFTRESYRIRVYELVKRV